MLPQARARRHLPTLPIHPPTRPPATVLYIQISRHTHVLADGIHVARVHVRQQVLALGDDEVGPQVLPHMRGLAPHV